MKLKLFHFFPDKLNLYGDRGNIIAIKKRCQWRGIELDVQEIKTVDGIDLTEADLLFIGGGSDREQKLCTDELFKIKADFKAAIEDGAPALAVCGGYQFLGNKYVSLDRQEMRGLEIFDFYTESKNPRFIGNAVLQSAQFGRVIGFENHGGRTYHNYACLGEVEIGGGNNGEDRKEGLFYKNLIGTYLHGSLLPKNPSVADYLIQKALERKGVFEPLAPLDDTAENEARESVYQQIKRSKK